MQSTTAVLETTEILKRDRRGRVWMKAERREALLDEFEKSGMSGAQFARFSGLNYSSFQNWLQRRRKLGRPTSAEPGAVRLLEAVVDHGVAGPMSVEDGRLGILVELPGGSRMRVETPVQLRLAAELLSLIAQIRCGRC